MSVTINEAFFKTFTNNFQDLNFFISQKAQDPISTVVFAQKLLELFENPIVEKIGHN